MNILLLVKKWQKLKRHDGGFSIVEALIAITVFAIAMLAILSMQTASVKANDIARGVTEQSTQAADQVERMILLPYNHVDLAAGAHGPRVDGRYTLTWSVADDAMIDNTKTITVTVAWNQQGVMKTINLAYIKPNTI